MKILWVNSGFLHPTTKGGQIRTLEILKRLHPRHEIHYVALDLREQPGDVERSGEYATHAYPIPHTVPRRLSLQFWVQVAANLASPLPLAVSRYRSDAVRRVVSELRSVHKFDAVVCDFLFPSINLSELGNAVLFQHNVEATIWKRHAEHARTVPERAYFHVQLERMRRYEAEVCRAVKRVIAVSREDADIIRSEYGAGQVDWIPTGVNACYFSRPPEVYRETDLVFVGSMDWMPNIDGIQWFVAEVLPRIRVSRPDCSLAIVGRCPPTQILKLAQKDRRIRVTGTVPDIRPYLWGSSVAIVPLRIGGGTRLKIYEAMAAGTPVVSTAVGAEGLDVRDGGNILLADRPQDFAERCLALLDDAQASSRLAMAAKEMVASCYSWDVVSRKFEQLLV